jgi:hypothetical protein
LKKTDLKVIIFFAVLFFSISSCYAQYSNEEYDNEGTFKDKLFFGGGGGFGLGDLTWVSISPIVGYRATERLSTGVGLTYRYTNDKNFRIDPITHDYGASIFARYLVRQPFFLHTEYEYLNFEFPNTNPDTSNRIDFSSLLAGGGVIIPVGGRAAFLVMALYNLSYNENRLTPYDRPWIVRGGITIGF